MKNNETSTVEHEMHVLVTNVIGVDIVNKDCRYFGVVVTVEHEMQVVLRRLTNVASDGEAFTGEVIVVFDDVVENKDIFVDEHAMHVVVTSLIGVEAENDCKCSDVIFAVEQEMQVVCTVLEDVALDSDEVWSEVIVVLEGVVENKDVAVGEHEMHVVETTAIGLDEEYIG